MFEMTSWPVCGLEVADMGSLSLEERKLTEEQSELVVKHIPLVHWIVNRMALTNERIRRNYDDCVQIGCLALADAVRNWKPEHGTLATYAGKAIWRRITNKCPTEQSSRRQLKYTLACEESEDDAKEVVGDLLDKLSKDERRLLWAVYGIGVQKKVMSAKMGYSYEKINGIIDRAITRLRKNHGCE